MTGRFIVLTGISGSGKSTIAHVLLRDPNLARLVTCTTREPRPGEKHGVDYFFLSRAEFERELANGAFFEHADVYGNLYGSRLADLKALQAQGKNVLAVLDIQGARTLHERMPDAKIIFVTAPAHDIERRFRERKGQTEEKTRERMAAIQGELAHARIADLIIENEDGRLEETVAKIRSFLTK